MFIQSFISLHRSTRCRILRSLLHVAWSVGRSVCLSVATVSCGQTAGRIELKFGTVVGLGYSHQCSSRPRSSGTQPEGQCSLAACMHAGHHAAASMQAVAKLLWPC